MEQHIYFGGIISEERCPQLHGHDLRTKELQRKRSMINKCLIDGHIFPTMAFRGQGAVPILYTVVGLSTVQVIGWNFLLAAFYSNW